MSLAASLRLPAAAGHHSQSHPAHNNSSTAASGASSGSTRAMRVTAIDDASSPSPLTARSSSSSFHSLAGVSTAAAAVHFAGSAAAAAAPTATTHHAEHVVHILNTKLQNTNNRTDGVRSRTVNELRVLVDRECRGRTSEAATQLLTAIYTQLCTLIAAQSHSVGSSVASSSSSSSSSPIFVQRGSLALLSLLLDVSGSHDALLIRLANALRYLLESPQTDPVVLHDAAGVLGKMARINSPLIGDLVNFQVKQAFEWVQSSPESAPSAAAHTARLLAAVLVLKELAANAPTLFNVYVPLFLDVIWVPLRSTRVDVREAAALALRGCLMDIATRAERWRNQCWANVFTKSQAGLQTDEELMSATNTSASSRHLSPKTTPGGADGGHSDHIGVARNNSSSVSFPSSVSKPFSSVLVKSRSSETSSESSARIHGSLLALGALLEHADAAFMQTRFDAVMRVIHQNRSHTSKVVHRTVMTIMTRAANLQQERFKQDHLADTLKYIETHMDSDQRDTAFLSLGRLSLSMGVALLPILPTLLPHLSSSLALTIGHVPDTAPAAKSQTTSFFGFLLSASNPPETNSADRHRRSIRFTHTAMACIGMLARGIGDPLQPLLMPMLDSLFASGLSQPLVDCLSSVAAHLAPMRAEIQERMIDTIDETLRTAVAMMSTRTSTHTAHVPATPTASFNPFSSRRSSSSSLPVYGSPTPRPSPPTLLGGRVPIVAMAPSSRLATIRTAREVRDHDTTAILLALRTLASFDFDTERLMLLAMAHELVLPIMTDEQEDIRHEAARTVTKMLPKMAETFLHSPQSPFVFSLLKRLLVLAISDPAPHVRCTILSAFLAAATTMYAPMQTHAQIEDDAARRGDSSLSFLLSQSESLTSLSFGLNEEVFVIRERVLALLAALAPRNPTIILPMLRTFLIQLLQNLHHQPQEDGEPRGAADQRQEAGSDTDANAELRLLVSPPLSEQHAKLLLTLISYPSGESLCRHYAQHILHVLLPKLTHLLALDPHAVVRVDGAAAAHSAAVASSSQVIPCMLSTIGKLSLLAGETMRPSIALLLQMIVRTMHQQAATAHQDVRRTVSIRTLAQLLSSTGQVISPYLTYPTLMPTLMRMIRLDTARATETSERRLVLVGHDDDDEDVGSLRPVVARAHLPSSSLSQATQREFRLELLKLVGKIGVINPYRFKHSPLLSSAMRAEMTQTGGGTAEDASARFLATEPQIADLMATMQASSEDDLIDPQVVMHESYFPSVALRSLLQILVNPRMSQYHSLVLRAGLFIFRSLGSARSADFLPATMPIVMAEMCQLASAATSATGTVTGTSSNNNWHESTTQTNSSPHVHAPAATASSTIIHLQRSYVEHIIGVTQVAGVHMRPFLAQLFFILFGASLGSVSPRFVGVDIDHASVVPFWREAALTSSVLKLLEVLSVCLKSGGGVDEFNRLCLPVIMSNLLDLLLQCERQLTPTGGEFRAEAATSDAAAHTSILKVMHTLQVMSGTAANMDEFLPLLIPALLRIMERGLSVLQPLLAPQSMANEPAQSGIPFTRAADVDLTTSPSYHLIVGIVQTLVILLQQHHGGPYASRLIHTVCRLFHSPLLAPSTLTEACFDLLCTLMTQIGFEFLVYFDSLLSHAMRHLVDSYESSGFCTRTIAMSPPIRPLQSNGKVLRVASSPSLSAAEQQYASGKKTLLQTLRDMRPLTADLSDGSISSGASTPSQPSRMSHSMSARALSAAAAAAAHTIPPRHNLAKFQSLLMQLKERVHDIRAASERIASARPNHGEASDAVDLSSQDLFHVPLFDTAAAVTPDVDLDTFVLSAAAARSASVADFSSIDSQVDATDTFAGSTGVAASPSLGAQSAPVGPRKLHLSQPNLMRAWTATQRSTRDDWLVWMRGFSIELLKESPSPALRACSFLAQKHAPLAHALFHASFLACWNELDKPSQDHLIENIEFIFTRAIHSNSAANAASSSGHAHGIGASSRAHSIPSSIVVTLLSLVEFMEHSERTLPIDIGLLTTLSERCHAFATALHYREMEFRETAAAATLATHTHHAAITERREGETTEQSPTRGANGAAAWPSPHSSAVISRAESTIESLITVNNKLGQKAAADGILKLVAQHQIHAQLQSHTRGASRPRSIPVPTRHTSPVIGFFSDEPQPTPKVVLKPLWFEKLHRWQDALDAYERRQDQMTQEYTRCIEEQQEQQQWHHRSRARVDSVHADPIGAMLDDPALRNRSEFVDVLLGQMRCLRSLGEWDHLALLAQGVWNTTEDALVRRELCGLAASAAVHLRRWDSLEPLLGYFDGATITGDAHTRVASYSQLRHRFDANYYSAIFFIHRGRFADARRHIDLAADVLDPSLSALLSESYARAYKSMLLVQRLVQLEEVMEFKSDAIVVGTSTATATATTTPRQRMIYEMWSQRITGGLSLEGDDIVDGWNEQLAIMQLVNGDSPCANEWNLTLYLQFCEILRKQFQDHSAASSPVRPILDQAKHAGSTAGRAISPYLGRSERILRSILGFDPVDLIRDLLSPVARDAHLLPSISLTASRLATLYETARPRQKLPHLLFVVWKLLYAQGYRTEAILRLREMVTCAGGDADVFSRIAGEGAMEHAIALNSGSRTADTTEMTELEKLRAICYVKLGKWLSAELESSWLSRAPPPDAASGVRSPYSPLLGAASSFSFLYPDPVLSRGPPLAGVTRSVSADTTSSQSLGEIMDCYRTATVLDPTYAKAWHEWAMLSQKVLTTWREIVITPTPGAASASPGPHGASSHSAVTQSLLTSHIVAAISGFFRSISLQPVGDNSLQDVLRILALWFEYGGNESEEMAATIGSTMGDAPAPSIAQAMQQGFNLISLDSILAVVPQLLARIHITAPRVRALLLDLLCRLGHQHPQALVFPLTVVSKSPVASRQQGATLVMESLMSHSRSLLVQAGMVSGELVRVAILWHELWHDGLEDASRLWFASSDFAGMVKVLEPLHAMIAAPQTIAENTFVTTFGRELDEASQVLAKCITHSRAQSQSQSQSTIHRSSAFADRDSKRLDVLIERLWELYTGVFRRIVKQISTTSELELSDVSPKLLLSRELELAVPGTYRSGRPVVRIASFASLLRVIDSKQHPRRLTVLGTDGVEYPFLLKGHEDLRQDERVMQLFGLVNTLLTADHATSKSDLSIQRYEVIPLSPNSGLIDDPLHSVIKRYRDQKQVFVNIEQRLMLKVAPDFHVCTIMQKLEVFRYALSVTSGQDLASVMWLHAPNSQTWLDRRECFTRSIAVMSMVGYILGLGDRHPCLVEGSMVPTNNRGHVPVEQLTLEDDLIGPRGTVKLESLPRRRTIHPPMTGVDDQTQELYHITTPFGEYTITGDHRLTVHWCSEAAPAPVLTSSSDTSPEYTHVRMHWWTVDAAGSLTRHTRSVPVNCTDTPRRPRVARPIARRTSEVDHDDRDDDIPEDDEFPAAAEDAEDSLQRVQYLNLSRGLASPPLVGAETSSAEPTLDTDRRAESDSAHLPPSMTGTKKELVAHFKSVQEKLVAADGFQTPVRNGTLIEVNARSLFHHRKLLLDQHKSTPIVAVAWTPLGVIEDTATAEVPLTASDTIHTSEDVADASAVAHGALGSNECVQFLDPTGQWRPLQSDMDTPQVKVALQLHRPLVTHGSPIVAASGTVSRAFNTMIPVLDAMNMSPADAGLLSLELQPVSSHTGGLHSHVREWDEVSLAGLRRALSLQVDSIVACGWFTRHRWERDYDKLDTAQLRVQIEQVKHVHLYRNSVNGLRIPYAVLEDGLWQECVTTVWFAPHPCQSHRVAELGLTLAAAYGKTNDEAARTRSVLLSRLPRMAIDAVPVTTPVHTYSLTIVGQTEEDRRHAIQGGILTHNCNLLLERHGGRLVHIDFGDCFETAMNREKHPERVPFRLTRMMVHAMEVAGIEGTFRQTCEQVMRVLRKNKNSVLAVLEAFSLDPLLNWRLFDTKKKAQAAAHEEIAVQAAQETADAKTRRATIVKENKTSEVVPILNDFAAVVGAVSMSPTTNGESHSLTSRLKLEELLASVIAPTARSPPVRSAIPAVMAAVQPDSDASLAAHLPAHSHPIPPSPAPSRLRSVVDENLLAPPQGAPPTADAQTRADQLNAQAIAVMKRVESKLKGLEFHARGAATSAAAASTRRGSAADPTAAGRSSTRGPAMSVPAQVQRLIEEATSEVNLAQLYIGWCPFW